MRVEVNPLVIFPGSSMVEDLQVHAEENVSHGRTVFTGDDPVLIQSQ